MSIETVAVDWAALIRAQKSDLCIDTRTKVTTGEIPKTTRPPNIHNPLREEERRATQNATRNRFPNPNVDETDAIKLNMWKAFHIEQRGLDPEAEKIAESIGIDGQEAHRNRSYLARNSISGARANVMDKGTVPKGLPIPLKPARQQDYDSWNPPDKHHMNRYNEGTTESRRKMRNRDGLLENPNYNPGDRRNIDTYNRIAVLDGRAPPPPPPPPPPSRRRRTRKKANAALRSASLLPVAQAPPTRNSATRASKQIVPERLTLIPASRTETKASYRQQQLQKQLLQKLQQNINTPISIPTPSQPLNHHVLVGPGSLPKQGGGKLLENRMTTVNKALKPKSVNITTDPSSKKATGSSPVSISAPNSKIGIGPPKTFQSHPKALTAKTLATTKPPTPDTIKKSSSAHSTTTVTSPYHPTNVPTLAKDVSANSKLPRTDPLSHEELFVSDLYPALQPVTVSQDAVGSGSARASNMLLSNGDVNPIYTSKHAPSNINPQARENSRQSHSLEEVPAILPFKVPLSGIHHTLSHVRRILTSTAVDSNSNRAINMKDRPRIEGHCVKQAQVGASSSNPTILPSVSAPKLTSINESINLMTKSTQKTGSARKLINIESEPISPATTEPGTTMQHKISRQNLIKYSRHQLLAIGTGIPGSRNHEIVNLVGPMLTVSQSTGIEEFAAVGAISNVTSGISSLNVTSGSLTSIPKVKESREAINLPPTTGIVVRSKDLTDTLSSSPNYTAQVESLLDSAVSCPNIAALASSTVEVVPTLPSGSDDEDLIDLDASSEGEAPSKHESGDDNDSLYDCD